MPKAPFSDLLHYLRRLCPAVDAGDRADCELLHRFVTERADDAFWVLMRRHGPMVLSVCRRLLGDQHLAEDAFQATFIVLARRAASIRSRGSLGTWLYAVAQRVAREAKCKNALRHYRERQFAAMPRGEKLDEKSWEELRLIIDEEIGRLPDKYQAPLVLCYLEGKSHDRASRELGWAKSSLERRLARGRDLLRQQLIRRGVTLSAATLVTTLCEKVTAAPFGALLAINTAKAAARVVAGNALGACVSARALALAEAAMEGMSGVQGKLSVLVIALGLAIGAAAWGGYGRPQEKSEQAAARQAPVVHTDRHGDALPDGAIARLGTVRWRHDGFVPFVGFLPDGKSLVSAGANGVVVVRDSATGRELRRFGRPRGEDDFDFALALSKDGRLLLAFDRLLRVYDTTTGKELGAVKTQGWPTVAVAQSADGKLLARLRLDGAIVIYDAASLREVRAFNEPNPPAAGLSRIGSYALALSPNGALLAVSRYFEWGKNEIRLWDTATGKELRRMDGGEKGLSASSPTFSPDGKLLGWLDAFGGAHLTEVATGKEVGHFQFAIGLAFTPDGKSLVGYNPNGIEVCVWDIERKTTRPFSNAERIQGIDLVRYSLPEQPIAISPDGKLLAVGGEQNTVRLMNMDTGQDVFPLGGHRLPVSSVRYSADGKTITTWGADPKILSWEAGTGKELSHVLLPEGWFFHVALSPYGTTLATLDHSGVTQVWDAATRKEIHQLAKAAPGTIAPTSAFSPDGKTLVLWGLGDTKATLYDVSTGRALRTLALGEGMAPDGRGHIRTPPLGGSAMVFSGDGRLLAMRDSPRTVGIWDVATARNVRQLELPSELPANQWLGSAAFTADARSLAVEIGDGTVCVWELATGRKRRQLAAERKPITDWSPRMVAAVSPGRVGTPRFGPGWSGTSVSFSADGDLLAQAAGGSARVWDLGAGKVLRRLTGHQGNVTCLAFGPNGRTLATGSADTTVLVWDMAPLFQARKSENTRLTPEEFETLWSILAGDDAEKAFDAVLALAAAKNAFAFVKERLKPATAPEAGQVAKWISELDSGKFEIRKKATDELRNLGFLAVEALQKAKEVNVTLEKRQRLDELIRRVETGNLTPAEARACRAVEVLERSGTRESRQLLESLSRGATEALVTREAKVALDHLARRPGS